METFISYRRHAVAAGILFIIATGFLFIGEALYKPALTAPDALTTAAGAKTRVSLGIMLEFLCVVAIPLIPIVLYPLLRRVSAVLAIGYVAFRLFEAVLFVGMEIDKMLILAISERSVQASPETTAALGLFAEALVGGSALSGISGSFYNVIFMTGALMLYAALWQARLIPRWISGWGAVSVVVLAVTSVTSMFMTIPDILAIALVAPLALQEMVMALWFIFKGFDSAALARLPQVQ